METERTIPQIFETSLDQNTSFEFYFTSVFRKFFSSLKLEPCEGIEKTPARFLKALRELTNGYQQDPSSYLKVTFESKSDDLVIIRDIPFSSLCEHHLMPFWGSVDIGYIPSGRVAGLSKFPRAVQALAHRLQIQERLTQQIREAIQQALDPKGVAVVVKATHSCMRCRGIRSTGEMITSSLCGVIKDSEASRAEFFTLLGVK